MKTTTFLIAALAVMGLGLCAASAGTFDATAFTDILASPFDAVTAMGIMMPMNSRASGVISLNNRARGVYGVRADAGNAAAILAELQKTFETFKAERDAELKGIHNKFADVVQTEKVDRINNEVTKLQDSLDQVNASIAAMRLGGGAGDAQNPEKAAYKAAFNKFFRKGVETNLQDLAVKAALQTDSEADGGYVVPETMESEIDRVLGTVSTMRSLSRVQAISTSVYKKLVNQGGAAGGWVGEREVRPETDGPNLAELAFHAMELYANPAATQTLLDDAAVDIEAWLAEEVNTTFAEMEGAAFISGDGVNKPRGILAYDTVADSAYTWGKLGYIKTGVAADINDGTNNGTNAMIDLVYSIKKGYRPGASFLMNRGLIGKVRKLKTIGDTESYLWQPSVQVGEPATLLGYPVDDDDNMSDVGSNAFPVAFGNFRRGYLIVDRIGMRVMRDPYTNKPYVHFYTTKRVGGGVQNFEAIKLLKCAT